MNRRIDRRLFLLLNIAFLGTGVIGCLLHECGHAIVAKALGYRDISVHYAYTNASGSDAERAMKACSDTVEVLCLSGSRPGHPCSTQLDRWQKEQIRIRTGGPATNMLIGTLGFAAIAISGKKFKSASKLSRGQWLLVLLSFFWSRQILNFVAGLIIFIADGRWASGDERRLSRYLGSPDWTLDAVTAGVAALILIRVVFYFVPKVQRLTFLLAGITGSALCVYLWLYLMGPRLMP